MSVKDLDIINIFTKHISYNNFLHKLSLKKLYTYEDLYDKYEIGNLDSLELCYDIRVYKKTKKEGIFPLAHGEAALARHLHDYSIITKAIHEIDQYEEHQVIAILGGHELLRTSVDYKNCALLCKNLAEKGYFILTGGGPGAMEAAHLGAYMSFKSNDELFDAINMMSDSPKYTYKTWLDDAYSVVNKYKPSDKVKSMAIPTWFYGHEYTNIFPTYVAKLFDNAIREHLLLIESYGGIICFPGSAGTIQEIFQKNTFNYYKTMGYPSPMIFWGKEYWNKTIPVIPFYEKLLKNKKSKNVLLLNTESVGDAIEFIEDFKEIWKMAEWETSRSIRSKYSRKLSKKC